MKVLVKTCDHEVELDNVPGKVVAEILYDAGLILNRRCGGEGTCGGCHIVLEEGDFTVGERRLSPASGRHRNALACKTLVTSDACVIRVPSRSRIEVSGVIDDEFETLEYQLSPLVKKVTVELTPPSLDDHRSDQERFVDALCACADIDHIDMALPLTGDLVTALSGGDLCLTATLVFVDDRWKVSAIETGASGEKVYGLAIDIGTTTVAGILVDLDTGQILQKESRYNQQITIADDVASRISAAKSAHDIARLQKLLTLDTLNPIINSVCHAEGIEREDICRIGVAGNTVMMHLLLALDVTGIGRSPFSPVLRKPSGITVGDLGIVGNSHAPVDIVPAIAGYVGGDITADIYVANMKGQPDGTLLVDLGTNGEIVLKMGGELMCCATPAGPAFEGGGLLHGCRASDGAIEHIAIDQNMQFTIGCIENARAKGICGSAVIDFIAEGYRCGLLNQAGRFDIDLLKHSNRFVQITRHGSQINACIIVSAEDLDADDLGGEGHILITEADIAEVLQAKSAIYAGIRTLTEHHALALEDIGHLILAGGFARHINLENAMCIGLLPRLEETRINVIGNGSLAGTYLGLVDERALPSMRALHRAPAVIELNLIKSFEANFVDSLFLPDLAES